MEKEGNAREQRARRLAVSKGTVWKEIPFSLLAALLLGVLANDRLIDRSDFSVLTRADGLVFLSFFIIFIYYTCSIAKRIEGMEEHLPKKRYGLTASVLQVSGGLVCLGIGGKWIVDAAVDVASRLGVSQTLIGLTVVAVGTSLPELATSAVAAYKKNAGIAVGNVVGSNIFNIFFVLGLSSIVRPLPFSPVNNLDTGVVIAASLLLFIFMFTPFTAGKRFLDRWEGAAFIALYAGYIVFIIIRD